MGSPVRGFTVTGILTSALTGTLTGTRTSMVAAPASSEPSVA